MDSSATSTALQPNFSASSSSSWLANNGGATTNKLDGICKRLWSSKCRNGNGTTAKEKRFRCSDFTIDHLLFTAPAEGRQNAAERKEQKRQPKRTKTATNGIGTGQMTAQNDGNSERKSQRQQTVPNTVEQQIAKYPAFLSSSAPSSIFPPMASPPPLLLAPPNWTTTAKTMEEKLKQNNYWMLMTATTTTDDRKLGDEAVDFEECKSNRNGKNGSSFGGDCPRQFCKLKKRTHFHCNICDHGFSSKQRMSAHLLKHSSTANSDVTKLTDKNGHKL
ncbi:hypothetical protein niasHS_006483 [Heterodera schachtii]|uniref:C2H2-type domain-containing protein n=1 Tax=Heterodera schachtii TaxID=97005 RepID=A0ABD2JHF3_HETSC